MKRLICLLPLIAISVLSFAQNTVTVATPTTESNIKKYISAGISIGNVNAENPSSNSFSKASFPAIEGGIIWKKSTLGLVLGCENFFATPGARVFYELKTTYSIPIETFSIYGLFGTGAYFEKNSTTLLNTEQVLPIIQIAFLILCNTAIGQIIITLALVLCSPFK